MNASKIHMSTEDQTPGLELVEESGFYVSVGDVVAGKYRVESVLGVGGMGFVLSAKHVELDERFALKFLNEQFLQEETIIERFTQEAKAACRIRSEHVARVYDVGTHGGAPFLVMEHLHGRDLATVVAESGALRIDDAVEFTMQACEALAVAHRQGVIHRDIKPENLFLVEHEGLPSIKVLDFGISKTVLAGGAPSSRLTGQLTLGTPCYMSPEQIRSTASADARSDLWSLGVVLYELLAGAEAFRAPSVTEVCAAVLEANPEPLTVVRPEIPHELADIVMRCLAKNPDDRFANVAELAVALLPFAPARALVSAERSSSLMRGARRALGGEHHISSVRPSRQATPTARSRSGGLELSPASDAPFARSVVVTDANIELPAKKSKGRVLAVAVGLCVAFAGVGLFAYPGMRKAAPPVSTTQASVAPSERTESSPSAMSPVAVRTAEPSEHASESGGGGAAASALPPKRPVVAPPPAPRGRPAAASATATATASASAEASARGLASAQASARGLASASPMGTGVELGY